MTAETPLNIWGKPGCELPNGNLCHACCFFYRISELDKPAESLCDFVDKQKGGCRIHELSPDRCQRFYCANVTSEQKLQLINTALKLEQISIAEGQNAIESI